MNSAQIRLLVLIAALSYMPALAFYYVGEEAIFPISSLEMWRAREWLQQLLFGLNLQHNPLFNWLIIPCAALVGWEYVLQVVRAITIAATLATAAVTGWLAWRLVRDAAFAWFAALAYLTLADVLFYRGWLAYVDPLFGFFIFASIAAAWIACEEDRTGLIAVAVASLTCAFLSKAYTAYVFYGVALLVLGLRAPYRRVLLRPVSVALHLAAAAAPPLWFMLLPKDSAQNARMFGEIIAKLAPESITAYLGHLAAFPLETAARLMPALAVAGYLVWRRRAAVSGRPAEQLRIAAWIAGLNFVPYWLAPHGNIRYLVPIYPVAALAIALILWSARERHGGLVYRWLAAAVALKFLAASVLFPLYQSHYRGENYAATARDVIARSAGHPLFTRADTASGLSVAGYIDAWLYPKPPLKWAPDAWESGFVIAEENDPALGKFAARYQLGGDELFLLCRGAACAGGAR
jgi:hypothetical protein